MSYDWSAFDVHSRTGFMEASPPLARLSQEWEVWENILTTATAIARDASRTLDGWKEWRRRVEAMPLLDIVQLKSSKCIPEQRRAHLVLAFLLHFYVHTTAPQAPIIIPVSLGIPLLRVSTYLEIPPLLTFADTVLYNWSYKDPSEEYPTLTNICSQTLFTGLPDEEAFYLSSARIELGGAKALSLMCRIKTVLDSHISALNAEEVTQALLVIGDVICDLKKILLDLQNSCLPDVYYNIIRPWLCGEDTNIERRWTFEGVDTEAFPDVHRPSELSGPSAGQSSLIHAFDVFIGVSQEGPGRIAFLERMRSYMPQKHRLFLDYLASSPNNLRDFIRTSADQALLDAYNSVVIALKDFREAHMIIATTYVIKPARRVVQYPVTSVKGTGGTDLVTFLKDVRNRTMGTVIH